MALPKINVYEVNEQFIRLTWAANPDSSIVSWNLYAAPSVDVTFIAPAQGVVLPGSFTLVQAGISNRSHPMTPGSVLASFTRAQLGLTTYAPCYFLLKAVDKVTGEGSFEVSNLKGVPFESDYFVDEAGWPVSLTYKNFQFTVSAGYAFDAAAYLDIINLLGRPAREIKISVVSGTSVDFKMDSVTSDTITVYPGHDFNLIRNELQVERVFFANSSAGATVLQVYVAA